MKQLNSTSIAASHRATVNALRCSIIVVAGADSARFDNYLDYLARAQLPDFCELLIVDLNCFGIDRKKVEALLGRAVIVEGRGLGRPQQFFDKAAQAATGNYLLLIRDFMEFDPHLLCDAVEELEHSAEKISISENANFIFVERSHYLRIGGFAALSGAAPAPVATAAPEAAGVSLGAKDLANRPVEIRAGAGTVIDPDVIIDCPESVKIGSNCIIRKGVVIRPEGGEIVIGDNCVINHYTVMHGKGGIYIGDWTIIDPHCGIYAQNHSYERLDIPITKQPDVGKGVYLMGDNLIGGHTVIYDDVTLGKGAVVQANSTVIKSAPMASIAVGTPAEVVEKRHSEGWDFYKEERAISEGMPQRIREHVMKRGMLIKELIDVNDSILDVGCGEGIITAILAEKNRNIVGCDYSDEAVEIAKKQHPHIKFIYSNSTYLAFNNESFTKVVMSDVAEHLMPVQFIKTLDQINRVLKKEGVLILATPITGKGRATSNYAHIYEYSEGEIKNGLDKVFSNVKFLDRKFGIFTAQKKSSECSDLTVR